MNAAEASLFVYGLHWDYPARKVRLEILQAAFPDHKGPDLPRNPLTTGWTYAGLHFRLLAFGAAPEAGLHGSKGRGRARFLMTCPECRKECSVGKFMLHARIHKLAPKEA